MILMNSDYIEKFNYGAFSGRRTVEDRRQFTYSFHIPERRCGIDRRSGKDRRKVSRKD